MGAPPGAPRGPAYTLANMDEIAHTAKSVLQHIESNLEGTDGVVTGFIRAIQRYATNAHRGDTAATDRVLHALDSLNQRMERIETAASSLTSSTNTTQSASASNASSAAIWRRHYMDQWQGGLPQASAPSNRSEGSSTPGVSVAELQGDREVTVKVPDAHREKIQGRPHQELVMLAEKMRERVALQKNSAPLGGGVRIEGVRKLPSGDVCVRANSAAGADVLRRHQGWAKAFGQGARIQQLSWGFVASGVPVREVNLTPDAMAATAREMQRQNASTWGSKADITHVSWLTRPREGQLASKLVVEVNNPVAANEGIHFGLIWNGQIHTASILCREGRSKQCRKCQKFGHVQSLCPNQTKCGHCAGAHLTWECPSTQNKPVPTKCANCGSSEHRASSEKCPAKAEAQKTAKEALASHPPYHRVPPAFRPKNQGQQGQGQGQDQHQDQRQQNTAPTPAPVPAPTNVGLEASQHAPTPAEASEWTTVTRQQKKKRGPGRPPGSKNKSKNSDTAAAPQPEQTQLAITANRSLAEATPTSTQQATTTNSKRTQRQPSLSDDEPGSDLTPPSQLFITSKKARTAAPDELMDEDWPGMAADNQEPELPLSQYIKNGIRYEPSSPPLELSPNTLRVQNLIDLDEPDETSDPFRERTDAIPPHSTPQTTRLYNTDDDFDEPPLNDNASDESYRPQQQRPRKRTTQTQ